MALHLVVHVPFGHEPSHSILSIDFTRFTATKRLDLICLFIREISCLASIFWDVSIVISYHPCLFADLACKNCPRNDLQRVECDVQPLLTHCSTTIDDTLCTLRLSVQAAGLGRGNSWLESRKQYGQTPLRSYVYCFVCVVGENLFLQQNSGSVRCYM